MHVLCLFLPFCLAGVADSFAPLVSFMRGGSLSGNVCWCWWPVPVCYRQ